MNAKKTISAIAVATVLSCGSTAFAGGQGGAATGGGMGGAGISGGNAGGIGGERPMGTRSGVGTTSRNASSFTQSLFSGNSFAAPTGTHINSNNVRGGQNAGAFSPFKFLNQFGSRNSARNNNASSDPRSPRSQFTENGLRKQ